MTGCGKGENKSNVGKGGGDGETPEVKWTAVDYKDTANIKGKATLDGMMPSTKPLTALMEHKSTATRTSGKTVLIWVPTQPFKA